MDSQNSISSLFSSRKERVLLRGHPIAKFFGPAIEGNEWQQNMLMHILLPFLAHARLIRRPWQQSPLDDSPVRSSFMSSTRRPFQALGDDELGEIPADVSGNLQQRFFSNLNDTLRHSNRILTKNSNTKLDIKHEYRLTKTTPFNSWSEHLNTELKSRDLLDVIDANIEPSRVYTPREMDKRKLWVRNIIINHPDEHCHRKILEIDDPTEIVRNIRDTRRVERNVTESSVRVLLHRMKIDPRERISNFIDRFDNVVREYHGFEGVIRLSKEGIRFAFYNVVAGRSAELCQATLTLGARSQEPMTMEEMRILISQLEAERKTDSRVMDPGRSDSGNAEFAPYDPTVYASTRYRPKRGNEDR
ncbi:hypothetical protein QAD02_013711 [Eretmocerus hayati]|uniref:Uncharacterized protein n=1 Tax=Eretmocerus hayati TaxID=131215 RepID=A0ACC2P3M6_9HYME|nr:hypothetical protein QAD02_013711 [Eretmocerus hayati]